MCTAYCLLDEVLGHAEPPHRLAERDGVLPRELRDAVVVDGRDVELSLDAVVRGDHGLRRLEVVATAAPVVEADRRVGRDDLRDFRDVVFQDVGFENNS